MNRLLAPFAALALLSACASAPKQEATPVPTDAETVAANVEGKSAGKPTIYCVGDSTVRNGDKNHIQYGWCEELGAYLNIDKIALDNRAIGGRSSRSYQNEGRWDKVLADLKPGDVVLLQFGHNDTGSFENEKTRYRAALEGLGEETREFVDPVTGKSETVHTYGWYMRKYIADAKARGVSLVLCSPIPHNDWKDAKVIRDRRAPQVKELAAKGGVSFIPLNEISALKMEALGQEAVKPFYPAEHTHTNIDGARLNAESVVAGLKGLKLKGLNGVWSPKGDAIAPYVSK